MPIITMRKFTVRLPVLSRRLMLRHEKKTWFDLLFTTDRQNVFLQVYFGMELSGYKSPDFKNLRGLRF